jgi:hypothetical protein
MRLTDFRRSLGQDAPPAGLGDCLEALWWAGKQDWTRAHAIVQRCDDRKAAWVHAYLHRVEGDLPNARYWYMRAGRAMPDGPLEQEWTEIAGSLQDRHD